MAVAGLLADASLGWRQAQFSLARYVGQTINLQFKFASDAAQNDFEGAYVDDIVVSGSRFSLTDANAQFVGTAAMDDVGTSVVAIGDFNADGQGDFATIGTETAMAASSSSSAGPIPRPRLT